MKINFPHEKSVLDIFMQKYCKLYLQAGLLWIAVQHDSVVSHCFWIAVVRLNLSSLGLV